MPAAIIFGCRGLRLSKQERKLFSATDPLGFILFGRNCQNPDQITDLVADLRACVGRDDAPVLIDQEGGRVSRLGPPYWRKSPPAARFGEIAAIDLALGVEAARLNGRLMARDLRPLGINVDCAPVLDLGLPVTTRAIGDRAFSARADIVAALGKAVCDGLLAGGVLPVIKHLPGHGRATVDSHTDLPRVEAERSLLSETDFAPFAALANMPIAMTGHLLFPGLDVAAPATQSQIIVEHVIRGEIGFDGLLLSDDISMQALRGDIDVRALAAWDAGCDIVLHCNGSASEMTRLAGVAPSMTEASQGRWRRAREMVNARADGGQDYDQDEIAARLSELLK